MGHGIELGDVLAGTLTQPSKYSLSAYGSTNVRLFKGFSFNIFTELSRTRDQNLPAARRGHDRGDPGQAAAARDRLPGTYVSFGLSYSFGSIFNNVVNPRFGGSGGNFF